MTTSKRALVTGGSRGIGFAIAQGLSDRNYEVVVTARSLESAKQADKKLGGKVEYDRSLVAFKSKLGKRCFLPKR